MFLLIKQKKLSYCVTQVYSHINCQVEMNISILIIKLNLVENYFFYAESSNAVPLKALFLDSYNRYPIFLIYYILHDFSCVVRNLTHRSKIISLL
jgi:hypothetical protein